MHGKWRVVKKINIIIINKKGDVYGSVLVVNLYMYYYVRKYGELLGYNLCLVEKKKNWKWENRSYQYYYTNDECKLISNIKFN